MTLSGNDAPWEGNTYRISIYGTNTVLIRTSNTVTTSSAGTALSQQWKCTKSDGWLYFSACTSATSGYTFLGRSGSKESKLTASAKSHAEWEYFAPRKHPDGGYWLYNKVGSSLWVVGEDWKVVSSDKGVRIGFTRV